MTLTHQIGKGAQADIFLENGFIYKAFRSENRKTDAFWEATITSIAQSADLPVARIYEVLCINNKPVVKMEYIQGETLQELMLKDIGNVQSYFDRMVKLQCSVYEAKAELPLFLKDVLRGKINKTKKLNDRQKAVLLVKLNDLPDRNRLCHNDFHGYNIICANERDYIIDWANTAAGCEYADGCYTYMLYSLYYEKIADIYLKTYCRFQNIDKDRVLEWLPVIAAARLDDNNPNDYDKLLSWIDQIL